MMADITFKKHTIEYYDWYDIQKFIETESGIAYGNIQDWLLGDYNDGDMIGLNLAENIIDLTENTNEYTERLIGDDGPKYAEALTKLKGILGDDITVRISW